VTDCMCMCMVLVDVQYVKLDVQKRVLFPCMDVDASGTRSIACPSNLLFERATNVGVQTVVIVIVKVFRHVRQVNDPRHLHNNVNHRIIIMVVGVVVWELEDLVSLVLEVVFILVPKYASSFIFHR
jgi:hypothetical protein